MQGIVADLPATAEQDMSTMGMSYAIALHEDFVKTCLGWLVPLGLLTRRQWRDARTADVHEKLERASGRHVDTDSLALFHLTPGRYGTVTFMREVEVALELEADLSPR